MNYDKKIGFLLLSVFAVGLLYAPWVQAVSLGEAVNFNVDSNYESTGEARTTAVLVKTTPELYFYVQKNWWDAQSFIRQNEIAVILDSVALEFKDAIYPKLTTVFGQEPQPGIDKDKRITILFHQMKDGANGYFRNNDQYLKLQLPNSNERDMMYLSVNLLMNEKDINLSLAHEFVHLITFNQKDNLQGVAEDVWLNEARADYTSTIMGYDDNYEGSNLQKRVRDFLNAPSDSLTEWQEKKSDYAVASLFTHYVVEHYGINILADSLKSKSVGIASINEALLKNGYQEDFAQIFTNWTIAVVLNDCSLDLKYCFYNRNLSGVRLNPNLIFLPLSGTSSLSSTNITKNWAGSWQKIIGGNGALHLDFTSSPSLNFKIPYIIYDKNNNYVINFLKLNKNGRGAIDIVDFGNKYSSLIIVPILQSKLNNFNEIESNYYYTFTVNISGKSSNLPPVNPSYGNCQSLVNNLFLGVSNKNDVMCLQSFLKAQGNSIYPEGLVTGYFGPLTRAAVIKFQAKYQIPNTGFVGPMTRTKINQMLFSAN